MAKGRVKSFNHATGYGFIRVQGKKNDVFVHYSDINMHGFKYLRPDDRVYLDLETLEDGSCRARNVTYR